MLVALVGCGPSPGTIAPSRVLRVCSDPNNLPFSNHAQEGFENRIAELVAQKLHAKLEYVWWPQRRGFVRNTLGAGTCDAMIGVPHDFERAVTTAPYYRSTYVFVTRAGEPIPRSFDDPLLTHTRIGVHLVGDDGANTPPAHALSARGIINNVHGYLLYGDYSQPNPPATLLRALVRGELDVAVAWGPLAGYFTQRERLNLTLTPVAPAIDAALPLVFDISMGVARGNRALLDELNAFIDDNRAEVDRILSSYNVPRVDR
jgi:mxaJ protein